jgi:GNAT superfamily N-acetyltransferase
METRSSAITEWRRDGIVLSDDPARLDFDAIEGALRTTYWADDRPRAVIEAAFRNSLPFALYDQSAGGRQVGFARVITDKVNFSWIADVWLDPALRGRGVGTWMMRCILEHADVVHTRQTLATRDAHAFYEKMGFVRREVLRRYPGEAEPPAF